MSNDATQLLIAAMMQSQAEQFIAGLLAKIPPEEVTEFLRQSVRQQLTGGLVKVVLTKTEYNGRSAYTLLEQMTREALSQLFEQEEFKTFVHTTLAASIKDQLAKFTVHITTSRTY